ncbi:MAG: amino acid permease [Nanoarchaeota archaeon]|nr:amino acid permease [Nanoarchaeota archaeon]
MSELKKVLSFPVILLITINSILGTGIFFLPALGAGFAGPASLISWIILALIGIYISMCFAELSSMFPKSGGIYEFVKQSFSRPVSFLIGWTTLVAANVTIAMLVVGAIQYLAPYAPALAKIIISLGFVFIFNYIAYRGMKTSATMLVAFAVITLSTLFALIIPGLFKVQTVNFTPFFVFPASAIFVAIFFIAETFFGWETATFLSEETKDGAKVMPKALFYGTLMIAGISLVFVFVGLGVVNWSVFSKSVAPLGDMSQVIYGLWAVKPFRLAVYLSIIGSVAGWIVSAPRLIFALAKDKLFLKGYTKLHKKYSTPYKAIILQTVLTSILVFVGFGSYETLLIMLLPMVLVMYSVVLISLVRLRYKKPNLKRYFRVPFGKIGPILVVCFNFALIVMWLIEEPGAMSSFRLGMSFVLISIPLYLLVEFYHNPKLTIKTKTVFAKLFILTENMFYPRAVRELIIKKLGRKSKMHILEYGCTVGTLTKHLVKHVKPFGKVHASDMTPKHLEITKKRLKLHHKHILYYQDRPNKVHKDIPKVDAIVSYDTLGDVEKINILLKDMNKHLKTGGKIVFVEFTKFFHLIPNIDWLQDDKEIRMIFKKTGFDIKLERKNGIFFNHIHIWGSKVKKV